MIKRKARWFPCRGSGVETRLKNSRSYTAKGMKGEIPMKKLLALVMALMMALSCFTALAEEPAQKTAPTYELPVITVTDEIVVNEEAVLALLPMFGIDEASAAMFKPVLSLLGNLSFKAVTDDSGLQFEVNLKGQNIATTACEMNDTGVAIASDLLPSYALTMSYETIQEILKLGHETFQKILNQSYDMIQQVMSVVAAEFDEAFANVDFAKIAKNVKQYDNEYINACLAAVTAGETQVGEFHIEANDYTFNACTPIYVNVGAMYEAARALQEQIKKDEAVGTLFTALEKMGVYVNLSNEEIADGLPMVEAWTYANLDEKGESVDGVSYTVVEFTYGSAPEKDFDVQVLTNENGIMFVIFVPKLDADVVMAVNATENGVDMIVETEVQEMYIGAEAVLTFGETICADFDLFFLDAENPILCEKFVIAFEGERTYNVLDENKTIVDVATLTGEEAGELYSSLMGDLMSNGLNGLLAKAAAAMPDEVTALMNLFMGTPAVEEAAE